ncbi:MAG: phosphate transporter substrate-binding protein [Bacillales bacterium]|jgi:phosphate transport system substrate-binding protein|nr:phosphate transporter substrate-binding protein [Bacillales bacterium]
MKKLIVLISMVILVGTLFTGCSSDKSTSDKKTPSYKGKLINVVSREDGSGTRGAFIELFGVQVKNTDGTKKDMTTKDALIVNKTDVVLTNVATDEYAIGYISLGSLNDTIKPLQIDGIEPSESTVKDGSYKIARPFNIVTKGETTGVAKDFMNFILSADGQKVVSSSYIAVDDNAAEFEGNKPSGKIVVAGSSSVTPIMEKLQEAYLKLNPNAKIEIQMSDSTTGVNSAIDGTCDIGMVSRELKDDEKTKLMETQIATDGIAVIVNKNNPVKSMTSDEIRKIYVGEKTEWNKDK